MKNFLHLVLFLPFIGLAQAKKVQADISTNDSAKLSILGVYQDDFPNISVVFKAERKNGSPVFGLKKSDMSVLEDKEDCQVISIQELSAKKPINIGVVLDHSYSMLFDNNMYSPSNYDVDENGNFKLKKGYKFPIDAAKDALNEFVNTFNFKKDQISVVGFSSTVDKVLSLSDNPRQIKRVIRSMEADESTAFYDALMRSLELVKEGDGLKVIVALTDGQDNASMHSMQQVIKKSKELDIPIYLVGLGDVDRFTLNKLASQSGGEFFYTNSAKSLNNIYEKISTKLQAFYDLVYTSPNLNSGNYDRSLEINFSKEGINVVTEAERFSLDSNAVAYIQQKEAEQAEKARLAEEKRKQELMIQQNEENQQNQLIGIAIGATLLAGGIIFYFYRRANAVLKISKIYPNPSSGSVNIEIANNQSQNGTLQIYNDSGTLVDTQAIEKNQQISMDHLPNGTYILTATFDNQVTKSEKVVLIR